ncbi:MAG TPA: DUF378 domain-containing protein [Oscillospiraceae bacterium]|nr:DUF378 domain-containing protein [Oscillospiraceae bacterium]HPS34727.1 DUF378 domain-containing protein [Oscillospiraceae bacterium]
MVIDRIALIIMIIGGLNWGSVGLFNTDLVALAFGSGSTAARIIYALVGIAALWCISLLFRERSAITEDHVEAEARSTKD